MARARSLNSSTNLTNECEGDEGKYTDSMVVAINDKQLLCFSIDAYPSRLGKVILSSPLHPIAYYPYPTDTGAATEWHEAQWELRQSDRPLRLKSNRRVAEFVSIKYSLGNSYSASGEWKVETPSNPALMTTVRLSQIWCQPLSMECCKCCWKWI